MTKRNGNTATVEEAPQVSVASYLDNRIKAIEADMEALQATYTAREAALAELKKMREAVAE